MRKILFIVLILLSFALGISLSVYVKNKQSTVSDNTVSLPNARTLPEFSLLDHNGKTVSNEILQEQWSLLFFGFTNCPDVCPNTLSVLSELKKQVSKQNIDPKIILVTVDPMRDTPEKMNQYVNSFPEKIIGLTGELHSIQVLTDELGVAYAYNALPDGSYTVDHSAMVFIINPDGKYAGVYTGNLAAESALKTLKKDFLIMIKRFAKK